MRGSTNKSPIWTKYAAENKLIRWFVYEWGKPTRQKPYRVIFKVTTSKNPLLSKQAVTSKGIPVPYTNLQLNPYPNTQLDLFCSDNLSFSMQGSNTWLTNYANPNTQLDLQLEKSVGCKVLLFITRWRSWNCLVTKPYGV